MIVCAFFAFIVFIGKKEKLPQTMQIFQKSLVLTWNVLSNTSGTTLRASVGTVPELHQGKKWMLMSAAS
jgi:hypothetical protein